MPSARGRDARRLRDLHVPIPAPLTLESFLSQLASSRGRKIVLVSRSGLSSLSGLATTVATTDYVVVAADAPPLLGLHIGLHEAAHLILEHGGELTTRTTPVPTPASPGPVIGRADRSMAEEWQAERLATSIAELAALSGPQDRGARLRHVLADTAAAITGRTLYRRLYPLWAALVRCQPGITFEGRAVTPTDGPLPRRGAYRALYRRVIEIYDGLRLILPYLDPTVVGHARQLAIAADLDHRHAEAVGLGAGIATLIKSSNRPAKSLRSACGAVQWPDALDLMTNAHALVPISQAFTDWPLISGGADTVRRQPARRRTSTTRPTGTRTTAAVTASSARMYDFYLGGRENFPVDREAAQRAIAGMPQIPAIARTNRAFLRRVVRFLAQQGVYQFLDIGSGIPTMGNVHEIAQQVSPEARVLYVDLDPVAVMHSRQLLKGNDRAYAIEGDLRDPDTLINQIQTNPDLAAIIDLKQPIALILAAVLHFVPDDDQAYNAVETLRANMVPGSWLALSQGAREGFTDQEATAAVQKVYAQSANTPADLRTREGVARFFDGFTLVDPGLVWVPQWVPEHIEAEAGGQFEVNPSQCGMLGGVGLLTGDQIF
jgi:hypothetical protein